MGCFNLIVAKWWQILLPKFYFAFGIQSNFELQGVALEETTFHSRHNLIMCRAFSKVFCKTHV